MAVGPYSESESDQDDVDDSESFEHKNESSKFVVYLVDAAPKMFSRPSAEEEQHFHAAVSYIAQNLTKQITTYDEVSICFFNTREKQNLQDLNSVFVFNVPERESMDRPTARLLKGFSSIEETFMKEIGSKNGIISDSRENSLYNALREAQAILRKRSAKTAEKRILLFTNEDDPFGDIKGVAKTDMTRTTLQLADALQDLGISIELPLTCLDDFNFSIFYTDLIVPEGEGRAQFMLTSGESMYSFNEGNDLSCQFCKPALPSSRYLDDFEELDYIGAGGFGRVALCKHKLDGRQYAMKKICVKSLPIDEKMLREVATLSCLQHQHVVRYYQAFVGFEPGAVNSDSSTDSDSSTAASSSRVGNSDFSPAASSSRFGNSDGRSAALSSRAGNSDSNSAASSSHATIPLSYHDVATDDLKSANLYIQMEYCPRTLHQVLGSADSKLKWKWFNQILQGLAYIHGQGVMHRDLTPQNIFLDAKNEIKIGDFGLAKFIEEVDFGVDVYFGIAKLFELDDVYVVGKALYMAPEIVEGWAYIDEKVDIYSLGIVSLELWESFRTDMERVDVIKYLKKNRKPPSTWAEKFPQQAAIMEGLMSLNPSDRPSANKLITRMETLHGKL